MNHMVVGGVFFGLFQVVHILFITEKRKKNQINKKNEIIKIVMFGTEQHNSSVYFASG